MLRTLLCSFLALPVMNAAIGQCQFTSVALQNYGAGCGVVFGVPPSITAQLDPVTCDLGIRVTAFAGCCNTFLRDRLLVLGLAPTNQPLPQVAPGCVLLASPIVFLWQATSAGDTFHLGIPPGLTSFTMYAQGAAHYFTTIGLSDDLMLTDGLMLTLQ